MIKLQVIGHLGKDCNVNSVNGKNVINFSVAHSEKYKDASGTVINKSTWVNCAYWVDRTNLSQYLTKGTMVFVEGQPEVSTFRGQDGQTRAELKLRVLSVQLLGGKKEEGNSPQSNSSAPPVSTPEHLGADDDLPF